MTHVARRAVAAGVGVLTAVVLCGGIVAVAAAGGGGDASGGADLVAAADIRAAGRLTGELTEPDGTGSAAGSAGEPTVPYLGNRTPGSVVAPFPAGQTSWSGVSNGINIHVTVEPAAPAAGDTVVFTAGASMPGQKCCNLTMQFGDDGMGSYPRGPDPVTDKTSPFGCAALDPTSDSIRGELRHVYNRGGQWTFRLSARAGAGCDAAGAVYGEIEGVLAVGGAGAGGGSGGGGGYTGTPQGPELPRVRPASIYPYERFVMTLGAEAADDDGYIARLTVDWGDGSTPQSYANPRECIPTASGWPSGTYTILPLWMGVGAITHRYRDDGPYKVTVTAASTGCDGSGEQRGSGTTWFPGPPASELPPPPSIEEVLRTVPLPTGPFVGPPAIGSLPPPPPPTFIPPPPMLPPTTTTTTAPPSTTTTVKPN